MAGSEVNYPSDNPLGNGEGMMFGNPKETQSGLIVIHEWWGKTDQIVKQGKMMAEAGNCVVLVPDMYRGKVAIDKEQAGHLMSELNWDGAMKDLAAAARYLKSEGCSKVCVTGFCMGGALAFASGSAIPGDVDAVAPFYGIPDQTKYDLTKISVPVQMHFGKEDVLVGFSSKKDYDLVFQKLKDADVNVELFEYDAGHAFVNPENRIGPNYKEDLAKLAFSRLYEFMKKYL